MPAADVATVAEPDRAYVERLLALSPTLATVRDLAQRFGPFPTLMLVAKSAAGSPLPAF